MYMGFSQMIMFQLRKTQLFVSSDFLYHSNSYLLNVYQKKMRGQQFHGQCTNMPMCQIANTSICQCVNMICIGIILKFTSNI